MKNYKRKMVDINHDERVNGVKKIKPNINLEIRLLEKKNNKYKIALSYDNKIKAKIAEDINKSVKKYTLPKFSKYFPKITKFMPTSELLYKLIIKLIDVNNEHFTTYIKEKTGYDINGDEIYHLRLFVDLLYCPTMIGTHMYDICDLLPEVKNDSLTSAQIEYTNDYEKFKLILSMYIVTYLMMRYSYEPHVLYEYERYLNANYDDNNLPLPNYTNIHRLDLDNTRLSKYRDVVNNFMTVIKNSKYDNYVHETIGDLYHKNINELVQSKRYTSIRAEVDARTGSYNNHYFNMDVAKLDTTSNLTGVFMNYKITSVDGKYIYNVLDNTNNRIPKTIYSVRPNIPNPETFFDSESLTTLNQDNTSLYMYAIDKFINYSASVNFGNGLYSTNLIKSKWRANENTIKHRYFNPYEGTGVRRFDLTVYPGVEYSNERYFGNFDTNYRNREMIPPYPGFKPIRDRLWYIENYPWSNELPEYLKYTTDGPNEDFGYRCLDLGDNNRKQTATKSFPMYIHKENTKPKLKEIHPLVVYNSGTFRAQPDNYLDTYLTWDNYDVYDTLETINGPWDKEYITRFPSYSSWARGLKRQYLITDQSLRDLTIIPIKAVLLRTNQIKLFGRENNEFIKVRNNEEYDTSVVMYPFSFDEQPYDTEDKGVEVVFHRRSIEQAGAYGYLGDTSIGVFMLHMPAFNLRFVNNLKLLVQTCQDYYMYDRFNDNVTEKINYKREVNRVLAENVNVTSNKYPIDEFISDEDKYIYKYNNGFIRNITNINKYLKEEINEDGKNYIVIEVPDTNINTGDDLLEIKDELKKLIKKNPSSGKIINKPLETINVTDEYSFIEKMINGSNINYSIIHHPKSYTTIFKQGDKLSRVLTTGNKGTEVVPGVLNDNDLSDIIDDYKIGDSVSGIDLDLSNSYDENYISGLLKKENNIVNYTGTMNVNIVNNHDLSTNFNIYNTQGDKLLSYNKNDKSLIIGDNKSNIYLDAYNLYTTTLNSTSNVVGNNVSDDLIQLIKDWSDFVIDVSFDDYNKVGSPNDDIYFKADQPGYNTFSKDKKYYDYIYNRNMVVSGTSNIPQLVRSYAIAYEDDLAKVNEFKLELYVNDTLVKNVYFSKEQVLNKRAFHIEYSYNDAKYYTVGLEIVDHSNKGKVLTVVKNKNIQGDQTDYIYKIKLKWR